DIDTPTPLFPLELILGTMRKIAYALHAYV
ncbi:unnamed protein product, partial [marine sediment metagenome]